MPAGSGLGALWLPAMPRVAQTATAAISGSRSPSVTFGSAPATGDLVVLFCGSTSTAAITIPSGWVNALGGTTDVESIGPHEMCAVYHFVTSGESGGATTTFTATNLYDNAETGSVLGLVVVGVDQSTPLIGTGTGTGVAATHQLAAVTPSGDNGLIVSGIAKSLATAYATAPSGWTALVTTTTNLGMAAEEYNSNPPSGVAVGPTDITP